MGPFSATRNDRMGNWAGRAGKAVSGISCPIGCHEPPPAPKALTGPADQEHHPQVSSPLMQVPFQGSIVAANSACESVTLSLGSS